MDEFNLAARFAGDEDERPRHGRGKIRRLRRGKTGVGMEKPEVLEGPEDEEDLDLPEEGEDLPDLPFGEEGDLPDIGEGPDMEEDEEDPAFMDLLDRMESGSASEGRAAAKREKLKGRRPARRKRAEEDEE